MRKDTINSQIELKRESWRFKTDPTSFQKMNSATSQRQNMNAGLKEEPAQRSDGSKARKDQNQHRGS